MRCARLVLPVLLLFGALPRDLGAEPQGRRYAFLVGASSYLFGSQVGLADLKYADDDALAFAGALTDLGWPLADVEIVVQGERAAAGVASRITAPPTRAGILERWKAFRERVRADALASGTKADGVVLLLSGHGVEFRGQPKGELKVENTYFVPVDAETMDASSLVDVQVILEELQSLPVNRRWFVYDACRKSVEAASRDYAPSSTMLQRLRVPQGTWLLLSCEAGQASYEARQLGHGVFLHHLVQGMRGEQAVNSEGELTLTSLADYAASATRRWVRDNLAGEEQLPVLKSEGTTWILADRARGLRPSPAAVPATPVPAPATLGPSEPAWARGLVSEVQRAEAKRLGKPVAFEEGTMGMRFVLIPEGAFLMGSPETEGGDADERPQHWVSVSPFYMSIHEVTNGQYRRFRPSHASGEYMGQSLNGEAQPVVQVSHNDATACLQWMSSRGGTRGYRLPLDAEWEYACRVGATGKYAFGDAEDALVGYANLSDKNDPSGPARADLDDRFAVTAPVGSYRPNGWGLYDMHGNVWEWCHDGRRPYDPSARTDPEGPTGARDTRVVRGGSWRSLATDLRAAKRDDYPPDYRLNFFGFRVSLPASAL
jgi:formylglycine-generating enzyme required for sulfatase activity